MKTCVLGHGWQEGNVLCPTCGFGPRTMQPELAHAAASQRSTEQTSQQAAGPTAPRTAQPAAIAAPPATDDRPRSEDGRWAWNGTAWEPLEQLPPLVPAQAGPVDDATTPKRRSISLGRTPSPRLIVGLVLLVLVAGVGAYATGLFGGTSSSSQPAPVIRPHVVATDAGVRTTLATAAAGEQAALHRAGRFTVGTTVHGTVVVTATAKGTTSFCVVGHARATPTRFLVWSSAKHGPQPGAYATAAQATAAC